MRGDGRVGRVTPVPRRGDMTLVGRALEGRGNVNPVDEVETRGSDDTDGSRGADPRVGSRIGR